MGEVLRMRAGKPVISMDEWTSVLSRANQAEFTEIYQMVLRNLENDPRWTKYVKVAEEIAQTRGFPTVKPVP